ncbi:MAG: YqeG family HAD IIIA-type phosphatase [Bacillota bacterium]
MRIKLAPDIYLPSVHDLDVEVLLKKNIRGIIIDIDNTLVSWETKLPDDRVIELIGRLKGHGFKLCILSNATKKRVEDFNRELKLPAIYKAIKPRRGNFRKAMENMGTDASNTAVIGDQVFTDVLGGNRLGLFTILVAPISEKEFAWTRLVRRVEKLVLRSMSKKG